VIVDDDQVFIRALMDVGFAEIVKSWMVKPVRAKFPIDPLVPVALRV